MRDNISAILYKGHNFCDFLFAFLHIKFRLKLVYQRRVFFPFREGSFSEETQNDSGRAATPESALDPV